MKPVGKSHARTGLIRSTTIIILSLLFLQYLLGMIANLFVSFPTQIPSVNPLESVFTNGPYLVSFHIANGLALGLLAVSAIVFSAMAKNKRLIIIAICGFAAILFAGESGIEFVLGWYVNDIFSFLMAFGYVLSFLAYFVLLWYASERLLSSQ